MFIRLRLTPASLPDQATEAIVDAALASTPPKPFAVIPCCVFPSLFPDRRQPDGTPVRTLPQFVAYLTAKDSSIRTATLAGVHTNANTIVYRVFDERC